MVVIDSTMSSLSKLRRNGRLLNWRPSPPHCSPLTGDEARKLLSEFSQIIVVSNFVWNFLKLYGALWMLRVLEPAASTRRQHLQQKWRSLSIVISYHRHHCQLSFKLSASLSIVIHIISIIVNCDIYRQYEQNTIVQSHSSQYYGKLARQKLITETYIALSHQFPFQMTIMALSFCRLIKLGGRY